MAALALRSIKIGPANWRKQTAVQSGLAAAVALLFVVRIVSQSMMWADDLSFFSRGLADLPNNSVIQVPLGNAMAERGLTGQAIGLYQEVLSREPKNPEANYNLGFLLCRLGKFDEAERHLRRVVAVNPKSPHAQFLLRSRGAQEGPP